VWLALGLELQNGRGVLQMFLGRIFLVYFILMVFLPLLTLLTFMSEESLHESFAKDFLACVRLLCASDSLG
jgi:hypothetical protein